MHRRRLTTRLLPLLPLVGALAVVAPGSAPASATGATCTTPSSASAVPDTSLDALFTAYGNSGTGWTGADSPHSVSLPDGRTLWFFDDTFLGRVSTTGLRNRRVTPYLHNSLVVQDASGALVQTLYNSSGRKPSAFVSPLSTKVVRYGFWPGGATVQGNLLYVLLTEYVFKQGSFAFRFVGDEVAAYQLPGLTLTGLSRLPGSTIDWSDGILSDPSGPYVYGFAHDKAYVAHSAPGGLLGAWQYYDGSGWTSDETQAAPIAPAAGGYSVSAVGSAYVLVGMAAGPAFSREIDVSYGCSPTGPFGTPAAVYTTPEAQQYPAKYKVVTYDAHAQPGAAVAPGQLEISYDVNSPGSKVGISTASLYRPRYLTLSFAP